MLKMLENVQQKTTAPIIAQTIVVETMVYTDEYAIYGRLVEWGYRHKTVNHSQGESARDEDGDGFHEVHVNTIEGLWSLLRSWLRPHRGVSQERKSETQAEDVGGSTSQGCLRSRSLRHPSNPHPSRILRPASYCARLHLARVPLACPATSPLALPLGWGREEPILTLISFLTSALWIRADGVGYAYPPQTDPPPSTPRSVTHSTINLGANTRSRSPSADSLPALYAQPDSQSAVAPPPPDTSRYLNALPRRYRY